QIDAARQEVMRKSRTAAIELNHFADFVLKEGCPALPAFHGIEAVRIAVQTNCTFLRSNLHVEDVNLLRDVADAFKHHKLDRKSAAVRRSDMVISATTSFGVLFFGEGKFGGAEQVIVTKSAGS